MLREEQRLKEKGAGGGLHDEELHNLYASANIIRVVHFRLQKILKPVFCNISGSVYSNLSVTILMSENFMQFIFCFPDKVP
jgi:hypothetical protein